MKIAIITDQHYGVRNDETSYYDYMKASNDWVFSILDSQNIKEVIHLGDLFDRRKYINFLTAKHCREDFLEPLTSRNLNVHILGGNHDEFYKDSSDVSSLHELVGNRYPNVKIHLEPEHVYYDGIPILLIPWIPSNKDAHNSSLEIIKNSNAQIAMGHLEINGFSMDGGAVCLNGIDPMLFSKFEVVASGHFHKPQKLGNINYLGAMYHINWGEFKENRGFSIFDTHTRDFTFFKNPYKIFHEIVYDDKVNENELQGLLKSQSDEFANKYIRIAIESKNNPQLFELLVDRITESKPIKLTFDDRTISQSEKESEDLSSQAQDTPTILADYVDELGIQNLDLNKMKALLFDIHKEAMSLESIE